MILAFVVYLGTKRRTSEAWHVNWRCSEKRKSITYAALSLLIIPVIRAPMMSAMRAAPKSRYTIVPVIIGPGTLMVEFELILLEEELLLVLFLSFVLVARCTLFVSVLIVQGASTAILNFIACFFAAVSLQRCHTSRQHSSSTVLYYPCTRYGTWYLVPVFMYYLIWTVSSPS